jgi:alcohol dehydrogenase class IV
MTLLGGTCWAQAPAGVKPEQLPRLVQIATADMCHQTNPRPCTAADFEALFKAAM